MKWLILLLVMFPLVIVVAIVTLLLLAWGTKTFVRYMDDG